MAQNSGPFVMSSHGHPSFNPRLPSSMSAAAAKRPGNGPIPMNSLPNTSAGPNLNIPPSSSSMRPTSSMGPMKATSAGMNPLDKANSMPYSSRYTRKAWPMSSNIPDHDFQPAQKKGSAENVSGSSFTIEPAADDDDHEDIYFSTRHIAAGRFQRNQRLISEIFNEVCIPDFRTNVSVDRILTLRRQVQALKTHRESFEKDLKDLEEKHVEKKRKFLDANDKFYGEYAEASSKSLSQEKISEILQKYEAMEKLQKERQLLLQQQQQQQAMAPPPPPPPLPSAAVQSQAAPSTAEPVPEQSTAVVAKSEPTPAVEVPQEEPSASTPTPPPAPLPPPQVPLPPSQPASVPPPAFQSTPSHPPPPSQSVSTPLPSVQAVHSQIPSSQPLQPQMSQAQAPVMQHMPHPQQQQQHPQQSNIPPQGYPMMHAGANAYGPQPTYGYPQQTAYRQPMTQRPVQYPTNAQWQQQQPQQQQWQTSSYDPRYYNQYPSNVQWVPQQQQSAPSSQQQQQQWAPNPAQQQMGVVSSHPQAPQMRMPPQSHQQASMYGANVHYGYGNANVGWNSATHPSQQYAYSQNPAYDPSMMSAPPQQQHYVQPPMHNPPQGYDYGPPQPQQQQQQQISSQQAPPMN